jgi:protease I
MASQGIIACLITDGFEDSEFAIPCQRLQQAGFQVELIGPKAGQVVKGKKGHQTAKIERAIDDVDLDDYVGLLIPGGHSPDQLRADDRFVEFVRRFDQSRKVIAAVCHGPQLFLSADLVEGRTLTAWKTVQGDLDKAGAIVKDQEVVVDRNWVTSRKPEDLEVFSAKFIEELGEQAQRSAAAREELQPEA